MRSLVLAAALIAQPVLAEEVYRLSPAEVQKTLDAASRRPDADNPALLPAPANDGKPHGEVGFMVGTGGARGIYGTVAFPLGQNASATISVNTVRLPGTYGYGYGYGVPLFDRGFDGPLGGLRRPAW
ncbi:MAG: hypothetical protein RL490_2145 [Pseudomonadota bacterium]